MEELKEKQKQAREWQRMGYSEEQAKQMAGASDVPGGGTGGTDLKE